MREARILIGIIIILISFVGPVNAKKNPEQKPQTEIVVNQRMIEIYNNMPDNNEVVSLSSLLQNYTFNEVKIVMQAYKNNQIIDVNKKSIDDYLAGQPVKEDESVYKKKPQPELITKKI
ncbi:MAG: hypothetical protein MI922_29905 [Bacteroidales bacterium]|nr:hypothetical protein [Bacteroidales bacterium]